MEHQAAHDELVSQFCAMSGTDAAVVCLSLKFRGTGLHTNVYFLQAQEYLAASEWDLEAAVTEFFAEQDEAMQGANTGSGQRLGAETGPVAGRTLGGSSSQSPSTTPQPSSSRRTGPKKRFATLGDFASGAGESSEEEDSVNQDFFAGGEKSGLAVQNPDDIKKKIIEKAKR